MSLLGPDAHHWRVIRAILLAVALVVAGWAYQTRTIFGVGADTRAVLRKLEEVGMATLTFTKTLDDGTVITYTATQLPGETLEQFAARARAEWARICAGLGG